MGGLPVEMALKVPMIIFRLIILAALLAAATPAAAQWWNPFSTRPSERPRAEQTELSRPLYENAMRSLDRKSVV